MNVDKELTHIDALRDILAYKQEKLLSEALSKFWAEYGSGVNAIFWNILIPEDPFDLDEPSVPLVYDIVLGAGITLPEEGEGYSLLDRLGRHIEIPQTVHCIKIEPYEDLSSYLFYQASEDTSPHLLHRLEHASVFYNVSITEIRQATDELNAVFQACSEYLINKCGTNVVCMATPKEITWRNV